ncbi:MAG: leucyl/phenylalanyl-tRNA--protein transferase [Actinomycetia bacterium]|nr:leucyl/phenylalanyl-tRNA--protein transferase [Actinomycetes bacterium]
MLSMLFGPPGTWPRQDLIGRSDQFDAGLVLAAYRCGVFPMPLDVLGDDMGWWSPAHRGVLPLPALRVSHSLRQSARRHTTTVDAAFERVMDGCADPARPDGWIDARVRTVYTRLFEQGHVHSVETWDEDGRLVGGLYGVSLGALFAGESMFHDRACGRDASKVALLRLVDVLRARPDGDALLDVQWLTPHLASLGAVAIPRVEYLRRLSAALEAPDTVWPEASASRRGWM